VSVIDLSVKKTSTRLRPSADCSREIGVGTVDAHHQDEIPDLEPEGTRAGGSQIYSVGATSPVPPMMFTEAPNLSEMNAL
jgi:hypothetical protein